MVWKAFEQSWLTLFGRRKLDSDLKAVSYIGVQAKLQIFSISKVLEVRTDHEDVRTRVDSLLEDEKRWIDSMVVNFEALLSELKASEVHPEIVDKYEENRSPPQEEIPLPAAEPSGTVDSEDNSLPAVEPSGTVDSEENSLPAAEPSSTIDSEDNFEPAAEPSGTVDLEENVLPAAEPSRAVDLEESHTSEDTMELERTALSQDQNAPELVYAESSPSPDISVMVSSVQPEITAGAHPVADNNENITSEVQICSTIVNPKLEAYDFDWSMPFRIVCSLTIFNLINGCRRSLVLRW